MIKLSAEIPSLDEPRILATRPLHQFSTIIGAVEKGPDAPLLYHALKQLNGHLESEPLLDKVANAVFALCPHVTHLAILLNHDSAKETLSSYVPALTRSRRGDSADTIVSSRSVLQRVLNDRAAVLAANAARELPGSTSIMAAKIRSTIGVPLWRGDRILGIIECDNRSSSGVFTQQDLDLLLVLAEQVALAIENAQLYEQLKLAQERLQGENRYLRQRHNAKGSFDKIVGESEAMKRIFHQLEKVIETRATICIFGETGTGKELIAQAIHTQGPRRERMFVAQNCAALPEELLESELFGHKKGAFTGADHDKRGLFEIADGGTLFLDEIGEMSLPLQAKLLRALQEGEIRPLGALKSKQVDVRIICATHRNLEKEVERGAFRSDLFYRLMVFPIYLPPLRERAEDIPALAHHFFRRYTSEFHKNLVGISPQAMDRLCRYPWRGNIRELENEIQRFVIQADNGETIQVEHLSRHIQHSDEEHHGNDTAHSEQLKRIMDDFERQVLSSALNRHHHNKTQTAAALGITREGLHKKLQKHGL